jgi:hypothetical protein
MNKFRFDYTNEFSKLLAEFAKENRDESRQVYKKKWMFWKEVNKDIYENEIALIKNAGYSGNIEEKIFESVRYYYRKKLNPKQSDRLKPEKLTGISSQIKVIMDNHIRTCFLDNEPPAAAFNDFCNNYLNEIEREIYRLKNISKRQLNPEATSLKFKKAYKNRYYTFGKLRT